MEKEKKKSKSRLLLITILLLAISVSIITCSVIKDSRSIGRNVGTAYGTLIGNMKGSIEGNKKGKEKGEEDARKPVKPDIRTITEKIQEQGKLYVMEAKLTVADEMELGEKDDPKYAILFSEEATANYYVDLSNVSVQEDNGGLIVNVPDVEVVIIEDPDTYQLIEEYVGEEVLSEETHNMQVESKKIIIESIHDEFDKEEGIKSQAREAAREQIADLSETLSGKTVTINFMQGN